MAKQTHIVHSDDPVRVTVEPLSSSDLSWFRLFRSIIHSGTWARLTPAAAKVLVVLAECVNDSIRKEQNRWIAWPSIATIGTRAGVERRAAQKAIALLESLGLVRRCRRRNAARGDYSNEYEMTPPPAHADAQGEASSHAHGGASGGARPPASGPAPAPRSAKRSPRAAARAQQRQDVTEYSNDSSIRARLASAGVGEPMLSTLLEQHAEDELLLRLKDWEVRRRLGSKFGPAWLIASIVQKYELHAHTVREMDRQVSQKAAHAHRLRELEADAAEEARQRQIDDRAQALFDAMSDEEIEHWKQSVLAEFPGLIRGGDRADPRTHVKLKRLILSKLGHLVV